MKRIGIEIGLGFAGLIIHDLFFGTLIVGALALLLLYGAAERTYYDN